MTNADKIRGMTDEELATLLSKDSLWLRYFHPQYCELVAENLNPGFCDDDCYECVLKWLNAELGGCIKMEKNICFTCKHVSEYPECPATNDDIVFASNDDTIVHCKAYREAEGGSEDG